MNNFISKYVFYLPTVYLKAEPVAHYLSDYRKTQWATENEIIDIQTRSLNKLLKKAAQSSAYYRKTFSKNLLDQITASSVPIADLNKFPILEKQNIVSDYYELISSQSNFISSTKTTGGSTGQAVSILKNPNALARERAATWRSYEWAGVSIGDRQARFWGTAINSHNKFKNNLIDIIANRKRLSAFEVNRSSLERYLATLYKFKPDYLYGYVSMIHEFCEFLNEYQNRLPDSVKSIITTSEVLSLSQRKFIENTTGLKVYNEYGCGEVGSIAHECSCGNMHIMSENLIVEIVDDNGEASEEGHIIVTDLHNTAMPLIRYRVGDKGAISKNPCPCGRKLPILEKIHGRAYDFITLINGTKIHPEIIMYVFEELKDKNFGIRQFQFIQSDIESFKILLVKDKNFSEDSIKHLSHKIKQLLGSKISLEFSFVNEIEREPSGKIRIIKREIENI